jgi:hypothetical protein
VSDAAGVLGLYRIWVVGLTPSAKIQVLSDIVRRVLPRGGGARPLFGRPAGNTFLM